MQGNYLTPIIDAFKPTHVSFGKSRIDLSITSCLRRRLHVRLIGVVMVSLQF